MKITLIRHSNTEIEPEKYNPLWKLSEKGIVNAMLLSKNPLLAEIDVLYTSNQLKAIHTGVIIASELGIFIKQRDDLTELTSLTNTWKADYKSFIEAIYSGQIDRYEDGESLSEAKERFVQAIEAIVKEEYHAKNIGIVAHGNVLALFASEYESRSALDIHHAITMPDIAVLDWESKQFEVIFGNYAASH